MRRSHFNKSAGEFSDQVAAMAQAGQNVPFEALYYAAIETWKPSMNDTDRVSQQGLSQEESNKIMAWLVSVGQEAQYPNIEAALTQYAANFAGMPD